MWAIWIGVRAQHLVLSESNDEGYHFGHDGAILESETNRERVRISAKLLEDPVFKMCNIVFAIDYSWTELHGHGRPPA